jgi:cobalt-zinc-cadmium efflux system membrane fusion protein
VINSNEQKRASRALPGRGRVLALLALLGFCAVAVVLLPQAKSNGATDNTDTKPSDATSSRHDTFSLTSAQRESLTLQPAEQRVFRAEVTTDGKIAVNDDRATSVFSPNSGIVKRLAVKPGDTVAEGQLLFTIEAADMVQAQNDFITAIDGLSIAESQLKLAETNEYRQHELFKATAGPRKDWEQSQADLAGAQSNVSSAEIALEAVRNRLRLLRKTEQEIADFQKTGKINAETPIYAPIAGTVIQRKVGPGQFITSGPSDPAGDPVFIIGDLSTVWLVANARESDALKVQPGQSVEFKILASGERLYSAKIDYTAEAIDPNSRRLLVRATVNNPDRLLKPEMFARVTIIIADDQKSLGVPKEAIIYEGDAARVWVATGDTSLALRPITTGLVNDNYVQITSGLNEHDKVVTKGALFIDRAASE